MSDFPTYNDLQRIARDEALGRASALTRDIIERDGSDANALLAVGPAVGDACIGQLIDVNAALFIDTAKGPKLDRLVFDRYQLVRKPASPALGQVQFTTSAPTVAGFTILAGTQLSTSDSKVFFVISDVNFPTASSGPITANVQSSLAGLNQQARAGTITSITSSIASAPGDLSVNNALATAGADDAEQDPELRNRAKRYYTTAKRGTLKAIEVGGLAVPGVRTAAAIEVTDADGDPARVVELIIADAFTEQLVDAAVLPGAYQAQAQTLATTVRAALDDVRAGGIQVIVTIAVVRIIGVSMVLRYRAGVDVDAATTQARVVAVNYVNSLTPGQPFSNAALTEKLKLVPGLVVLGGEVISPPGDVIASPLEVLRTSFGAVTVGPSA